MTTQVIHGHAAQWAIIIYCPSSPQDRFFIAHCAKQYFSTGTILIGKKPSCHILVLYYNNVLSLCVYIAPLDQPHTSIAKPPQQQPFTTFHSILNNVSIIAPSTKHPCL